MDGSSWAHAHPTLGSTPRRADWQRPSHLCRSLPAMRTAHVTSRLESCDQEIAPGPPPGTSWASWQGGLIPHLALKTDVTRQSLAQVCSLLKHGSLLGKDIRFRSEVPGGISSIISFVSRQPNCVAVGDQDDTATYFLRPYSLYFSSHPSSSA